MELEPDDIVAFGVAVERFKVDLGLVHRPELLFFKDFLTSLGVVLPASGAVPHSAVAVSADLPADVGEAVECANSKLAGPSEVFEIDSEEEDAAGERGVVSPPEVGADDEIIECVGVRRRRNNAMPTISVSGRKGVQIDGDDVVLEFEEDEAAGELDNQDTERLPREAEPYPPLPPVLTSEPSQWQKNTAAKAKQDAAVALERGEYARAMDKYTEAVHTGCATALTIASRAEVLLKLKRPCAAIRDCAAALRLNPDCGKAYRIRGISHRRLGHWKKSHRDLSQGQKLDFNDAAVAVQAFVNKKLGIIQDVRTGTWQKMDGAESARKLIYGDDSRGVGGLGPGSAFRVGTAVRIEGLQSAPHLNGKRGVIQGPSTSSQGRWDVELRLDGSKLDVKALRPENVVPVKGPESQAWKDDEKRYMAEKRRRDEDDRRRKEQDETRRREEARKKEVGRRLGLDEDLPDMDLSELVEAEMSGLPIDEKAMGRLRKLPPEVALELLKEVSGKAIGNMSIYIAQKVKQFLGGGDSEDDKANGTAHGSGQGQQVFDDSSSDECGGDDPERMQEESEPFLPLPGAAVDPTDEQLDTQQAAKREAAEALESGDLDAAIGKYTEAIQAGGSTALLLAKRAELLLTRRRPCGAIRDCSAALEMNADCGKAYRVRGVAYRRLGHWREAHSDLAQGLTLDFDEAAAVVQRFIAERVRALDERARRRGGSSDGKAPPPKRPRTAARAATEAAQAHGPPT